MGNRGSKSDLNAYNKNKSVKEQRVDGSYCIKSKLMLLRYTLVGGASRYRIKIHSKQLNVKNLSTLVVNWTTLGQLLDNSWTTTN